MLGYDDSLDAFGVHGVGGFLGAVLTGVFCYAGDPAGQRRTGYFAHKGLPSQIEALKKEATDLDEGDRRDQEGRAATLKKEMDDAAAEADKAEGRRRRRKTLQKKADAAKAEYEEIAKKVERREARIKAIEAEQSEDGSELKTGRRTRSTATRRPRRGR